MADETFEQLLERAAATCGIEPGYWDIWGKYHETTSAVRQSILAALGVPASHAAELRNSLGALTRREWDRLLPPAVVVSESAAPELPINVPAEFLGDRARLLIRQEDGQTTQLDLNPWELAQSAQIQMDGRTWVRKQARLPALPLGYHQVILTLGNASASTRLIVTPDHAFASPHLGQGGRAAGLAVSLYGVRSPRNWGCGDFRDLLAVVDFVAEDLQASFVSLNPLHAIHNRRPFNTSPYLPNSTFYQNFLYLDVEALEDFAGCGRARVLWESSGFQQSLAQLRAAEFVEYEKIADVKLRFLKLLFLHFLRTEWRIASPRARQFQAFLQREGALLESFATYCALDEHNHRLDPQAWLWTEWPAATQNPASPEVTAFRQKHWRRVLFYQFLQWQIDIQLSRAQRHARHRHLSIGLYHDLALATDSFGSDLWAHRPFYAAGCHVGAPPDDFSPKGQDWGFPPPNVRHHREDGYRLFAESIRKNCRHGGALRIDHVMRLFRLYWIPDGSDATQGAYVRESSEDFVRILALESVRNQVVVVGEDLGTVEPSVRETLARFGILSYRLFYFEKNQQGEFRRYDEYPRQALVSSTTHDLPTLAGYWVGADIAARRAAGTIDDAGFRLQSETRAAEKQKMLDVLIEQQLLPPGAPRAATEWPELSGPLHDAIVGFLALTPSQLLAINQEDLTKELHQQNLPSTTWQYPNWGRKMRFTVDQLRSDSEARGYATMFRNWIERSGRRNRL